MQSASKNAYPEIDISEQLGQSKIARALKVGVVVLMFGLAGIAAGPALGTTVLVEAESFADKGGWVVDQQFVEQMGSPYLLAHGLGKPVENAKSEVEVPEDGRYRVWVRTKDWVPGDWEAPGRFQVGIDGQWLNKEFGENPGWHWQDGGVVVLSAGEVELELKDLTGFDGRCDAILLTSDLDFEPPNQDPEMRDFRDKVQEREAKPPLEGEFDVVIVGGGISGCAAALAADRRGLKTALIQDRPTLGGNASAEVRVHTEGIHGYGGDILKGLDTKHWPNGSPQAVKDDRKRHATMEAAENVEIYLGWRAFDAITSDDRVEAVYVRNTESGRERRFEAPVFVDTTGDGWIGYWAGADYAYGRESSDKYGEEWPKHGELWSSKEPDNRVMGASLLFQSRTADEEQSFPEAPWAKEVANGNADIKSTWYWEYISNELHQIEDSEQIRDHLLQAIYGSFANAKEQAGNAKRELKWVGYILGKRESRRLMGDYIYTMEDMTSGRKFPDAVVKEKRNTDLHYSRQFKDSSYPYDFFTKALYHKVETYYVPYRSLYSRNIENLFMAGRCFSCSHVGLGGPRVMNTCGQMGIAVGYAASICTKYGVDPRDVYTDHLDELMELVNPAAHTGKDGPN